MTGLQRVSLEDHAAAVATLLEPTLNVLRSEQFEVLPVDPQRIAAHPDHRNRVLAVPLHSAVDLPPFDNSQMDGYAVRSSDLAGADQRTVSLAVADPIAAGTGRPVPLAPACAAPIMTGAPLPTGADAVIPIEEAEPNVFLAPGTTATVRFRRRPPVGHYVRRRGSDLPAHGLLLSAGCRLGPAQWGLIAAAGYSEVLVRRRLRILLVATGAELGTAGSVLADGQIHDSNSAALAAAIGAAGAELVRVAQVPDRPEVFLAELRAAADECDLALSTGGVSAGAFEVVREALAGAGVRFGSVAMQPGGPQGLGVADLGSGLRLPVLAFPGNPVSALISFEVFLRPVLRAAAGFRSPHRTEWRAPLAEPLTSPADKHQLRRGRIDAAGRVLLLGGPGSHLLSAYAAADVLVSLPVGLADAAPGDLVTVWRIDD